MCSVTNRCNVTREMRAAPVMAKHNLSKALTLFSLEVRLSGSVCSTHSRLVRRVVRLAAVMFIFSRGENRGLVLHFSDPGWFAVH